jgi:hypothetical protein
MFYSSVHIGYGKCPGAFAASINLLPPVATILFYMNIIATMGIGYFRIFYSLNLYYWFSGRENSM